MTTLVVILIIFTALLLALNITYGVQRIMKSRMFRARRLARQAERNKSKTKAQEVKKDDAELPEEILLVLISAAVAATYKKKRNVRFRVVSFGRIGKK